MQGITVRIKQHLFSGYKKDLLTVNFGVKEL